MVKPVSREGSPRAKTWCERKLGRPCLLEDYPEYRHQCLAEEGLPCEFGSMLETLDRLPLEVRLDALRKLAEYQRERLEEFES